MISTLFLLAQKVEPVANARVVAAVVKRGRIISIANNQRKSHPLQKKYGGEDKIYLHAEVAAILAARKQLGDDLSGCDIYVARAKRCGKSWVFGLAKPCEGCAKCIARHNLREVYYTV